MADKTVLDEVSAPPPVPKGGGHDVVTEREREFEVRKREQIIAEKDQQLQQTKEEHELRKKFLHTIYTFVATVVYAALLLAFFTAAGMIHLSDAVLIALLTTTIANVLGCLFIAFNWLFPKRERQNEE